MFSMNDFFKTAGEVLTNAVKKECTFYNDTPYPVEVVDHDGTRTLDPGESEGNYLVTGFSLDLVMKFPDYQEAKINFPSSRFENRTHRMSSVFGDAISSYEDQQRKAEEGQVSGPRGLQS